MQNQKIARPLSEVENMQKDGRIRPTIKSPFKAIEVRKMSTRAYSDSHSILNMGRLIRLSK